MEDKLINDIVGRTETSNKKQVLCQCAATIYTVLKDVDKSISIAKQIVDLVYD